MHSLPNASARRASMAEKKEAQIVTVAISRPSSRLSRSVCGRSCGRMACTRKTGATSGSRTMHSLRRFGWGEMQRWLAELAKKKSGLLVRHCRIFLRTICLEDTEQDYIRKNPARLLKVPRTTPVHRPYLEVEQVTALLKAAKWHPRERTLL